MKEELLEKLVKEIAAQNRLIALRIAEKTGVINSFVMTEEERATEIFKKAQSLLEWGYDKN